MSYARVTVAGHQIYYYDNVTEAETTGEYLSLHLSAHPSHVHFWRGPGSRTSVLLAADGWALTAALREEQER